MVSAKNPKQDFSKKKKKKFFFEAVQLQATEWENFILSFVIRLGKPYFGKSFLGFLPQKPQNSNSAKLSFTQF